MLWCDHDSNGFSDLIGLMVDRVGERLLYCGIGIVTETLCFGLTGYFFDFFLNDIILEITEGISQLEVL